MQGSLRLCLVSSTLIIAATVPVTSGAADICLQEHATLPYSQTRYFRVQLTMQTGETVS